MKEVLQSLVDDGIVDFEKIGAQNFFWAFPSKAVIKVPLAFPLSPLAAPASAAAHVDARAPQRENKIKALDESLASAKAKRDELKAKVEELTEGREPTVRPALCRRGARALLPPLTRARCQDERSAALAAHAEASDRLKKLKEELQVQRENDPETLRELGARRSRQPKGRRGRPRPLDLRRHPFPSRCGTETTANMCRDAANRWTGAPARPRDRALHPAFADLPRCARRQHVASQVLRDEEDGPVEPRGGHRAPAARGL